MMIAFDNLLAWLSLFVAGASVARAALVWLENPIAVWIEKTEDNRFWRIYGKVERTLAFLSVSPMRKEPEIKARG